MASVHTVLPPALSLHFSEAKRATSCHGDSIDASIFHMQQSFRGLQSGVEAGSAIVIKHGVNTSGAGTGCHRNDILRHLRWNIDPVPPSTDDGFSINGSKPKLVADPQSASIGDPMSIHQSLPVGSIRYEILHVSPSQGWTEKKKKKKEYVNSVGVVTLLVGGVDTMTTYPG